MGIFRQGDVLIVRVGSLPDAELKPVARENGKIILARGEMTGHTHAIANRSVKLLEATNSRFLVADNPFVIRHEEHAPVRVPAGTFRVVRQREYSPEEIRRVKD